MQKETVLARIGVNIRVLRDEKKISQQDVAALCNFEKSNMSRIEAGKTNLTIGTLLKICEALNVKLIDIIGNADIE